MIQDQLKSAILSASKNGQNDLRDLLKVVVGELDRIDK